MTNVFYVLRETLSCEGVRTKVEEKEPDNIQIHKNQLHLLALVLAVCYRLPSVMSNGSTVQIPCIAFHTPLTVQSQARLCKII